MRVLRRSSGANPGKLRHVIEPWDHKAYTDANESGYTTLAATAATRTRARTTTQMMLMIHAGFVV